ncbi:MAG: 6,7-dimethyl-8-ribityllumazine synthase [Betaproteobacteria bacterium]|nr:6,7-dimethyl-8-ribityllumazine synthase [Betaproteobacteria bacterium]MBV9360253.1 6,7-dimethyl-8-ribityllumazine synthase [Betaproteobacteria bacterium]
MRLGIVASRFNDALASKLLERAQAEAKKLGAQASVVSVPGALEIPVALQWMAKSGKYDALVAVGLVIRGETYHFEVVSNESARGVMDVALDSGLPIANGILTTEDEAQAEARLDKGAEAVRVAVEMAKLKSSVNEKR